MSQENVEVVRAVYQEFACGHIAGAMKHLDPEIEWLINPAAPEAGTHHGHQGVEAWLAAGGQTFSEFQVAPDEFLDAGDEVVCAVRIRVRGKASGAEAELRETHVWTLADGVAVRMKAYSDHAKALEAAGIEEEAMSQENVEVVRRGLEAFNQGDLDGALDMYDPPVEVKTLLSGSAHGRDEVRAVILEREKEMGAVQYVPEDLFDAGDTIIGVVRVAGRGRLSGISDTDFPTGQQLAFVWTLRGGLVIRQEMFSTEAEALAAAGLAE